MKLTAKQYNAYLDTLDEADAVELDTARIQVGRALQDADDELRSFRDVRSHGAAISQMELRGEGLVEFTCMSYAAWAEKRVLWPHQVPHPIVRALIEAGER